MKLIVGLGNPGRKYAKTRHNVGFDVLDALAAELRVESRKNKFDGVVAEKDSEYGRLLLLWPQTYMNLSGTCVAQAMAFFKLDTKDLLVVCDDFHIDVGRMRFRPKGSAAGQKGLGDILRHLATDEIARLRIGVGPLPERWDAADFVLSRFSKKEREIVDPEIARGALAIQRWAEAGIGVCMNEFNAANSVTDASSGGESSSNIDTIKKTDL